MGAVRESLPARDAADGGDRRSPVERRPGAADGETLARAHEHRAVRQADYPARVSRALASYARVADAGEQNSLRELLGFDAYA